MTLNLDCVRDLLLVLEDQIVLCDDGYIKRMYADDIWNNERMKQYGRDLSFYALQKLIEAEYVAAHAEKTFDGLNYYFVYEDGITFAGHQYLNAVRSEPVWTKVRKTLVSVGNSAPFALVMDLAAEILKQQLFPSK